MSWTKRFIFISIGIIIPLLFAVLILELIFGSWVREDRWKLVREMHVVRNVHIIYDVEHIFGKDIPKASYTRDVNGLRGSCADPKDITILTVGGSTTDQRFLPDGMTYQDVFQKLLSDTSNRSICVSNAGMDGQTTYGHLAAFKRWFPLIEGLKPKYVLFYIGINDAAFETQHFGADEFSLKKKDGESDFRHALRLHSAIYDLVRSFSRVFSSFLKTGAYAVHGGAQPSPDAYVVTENTIGIEENIKKNVGAFDQRLKALLQEVVSLGATPVCVSQPHLFARNFDGVNKGVEAAFFYEGKSYNGLDYDASIKSLNNSMKYLCPESGGYYIDISTKEFSDGDFYDYVHTTPSGASRIGRYLFDEFIRQKIF